MYRGAHTAATLKRRQSVRSSLSSHSCWGSKTVGEGDGLRENVWGRWVGEGEWMGEEDVLGSHRLFCREDNRLVHLFHRTRVAAVSHRVLLLQDCLRASTQGIHAISVVFVDTFRFSYSSHQFAHAEF